MSEVSIQEKKDLVGTGGKVAISPATGEIIGEYTSTNLESVPEIFARARQAQKEWAGYSFSKRKKHILKMRDYIVEHAEELADIVSKENGKSRVDALATEVVPCALAANWYAKNARRILKPFGLAGSTILFFNKKNQIIHVPLGVVGIISPWNYPLSIPFGEVAMGLMAGNAIVLKVAGATVMVGKAIERIVDAAELPSGLFSHVIGSGGQVSTAMFHNGVDKIFFTGSVPTGKELMRQAADTLTPLSLELGGKDPMVVFDDADLERATNGAVWAGYQNAGQSCGGVERIYVQEKVYDRFVELLAKKTSALRHGPDLDFDVDMGSMTTEAQKNIVHRHVQAALENGAKVVATSRSIDSASEQKGFFYPATLVTGVNHDMDLMREETFGPVLPVMKFRTEQEAVELANDSTMALTSSVWTKSKKRGRRVAAALQSGVTTVNDHLYTHGMSETPWGGWKESGMGRTHGKFGLLEMTHTKLINYDILSAKRNIWWHPFSRRTYDALLQALRFNYAGGNPFRKLINGLKLMSYMIPKMFGNWKV
ncbi:MAG: aldehyde dehydrogenase family protein [Leptospiraceae bacterium]|nr:aldehyde dehydrogenase family protein [Leptospiraceae bacterium]